MSKVELYVLANPQFTPDDLAWLKSIRAEYCPEDQTNLPPHITLAFSLPAVLADSVRAELQEMARQTAAFDVFLNRLFHEPASRADPRHYLFLKPGPGSARVTNLHESLAKHIPQIRNCLLKPFDPHLTIGIFADEAACEAAMDGIEASFKPICGRIVMLSLLEWPGDRILAEIPLIGRSSL